MNMRALVAEPARPRIVREHPWAPWLAVTVVCFGAFMGQLDASIVTLAFPALQRQFGTGLAGVQWVSLSYLLALVALLIPVGRWSDRAGRKLLYLYGFALFSVASAVCGLAPSLTWLIGARVVQAGGAALLQANSIALVSTSVGASLRRKALGVQAVAQAAGLALGPSVGGLIVASAGWRWVFLINPPVGVLAIVTGIFLLPRTRQRAASAGTDPAGMALLAVAVTGLLLATSAASGLRLPAGAVAALAVLAVAGTAGLVRWERRARQPLIDEALLRIPGVGRGLAGALAAYMVLFGPLVLYPQILRAGQGVTTGLLLTALPAGFALGAVLTERLVPSWPDHLRCWAGGAVAVLAAVLLGLAGAPGPGQAAALLALLGFGLGTYIPANNSQVMGAVPAASAATTGGMVNMARGLGTAFGVALVTLSLHLAGVGGAGGALAAGEAAGGRLTMIALAALAALAAVITRRGRAHSGGHGAGGHGAGGHGAGGDGAGGDGAGGDGAGGDGSAEPILPIA